MTTVAVRQAQPESTGTIVVSAIRLAGLAGLALLAEPLSGVADTAAAGHLGMATQGSLAIGAGIVMTATWLLSPLMFTQTTEIAALRAKRQTDSLTTDSDIRVAVRRSVYVAAAWGLTLACVVLVVAHFVINDSGATGYLSARALGLPITAVVLAGYGALRGAEGVRDVTLLALSGAAVHVGLVIAGSWAQLGLVGIGAASGASQFVIAVAVVWRLRARGLWPQPAESATPQRRGQLKKSIAAVGLLASRSALLGGAVLAMTASAAAVGPASAAAHLVTYQVFLLIVLAVEGWKSAAQILVSSATTDQQQRHRERVLLRFSAPLGLIAAGVVVSASALAIKALAADAAVAREADSIWWLSALSLGVGAVAFTRDGIQYGRGAYLANVFRILVGTLIGLVGCGVTQLAGDIRWMWAAMALGLLARALWPHNVGTLCRWRFRRPPEK